MKALFIENLEINDEVSNVELSALQLHHLKKVTRTKVGEKLLLLSGYGTSYNGEIISFEKKSINFKFDIKNLNKRKFNLSIALAMPKKEAFEEIVQNCIQLGVSELFTYSSEFSQYEFRSVNERLSNLMIGAYQQSNNPFLMKIHETSELKNLKSLVTKFSNCLYFSSIEQEQKKIITLDNTKQSLIFIGPEGGLSESEELFLSEIGFELIHLPTPILKSSNAVSATIGYFLALS